MPAYDAIVLGAGGVGSAAAFHLASRGARTLVLEQFTPAHQRGSSHGQTRIIRQAYFEHSDYTPLLQRTYELWRRLQEQVGRQLFFPVGLLEIGPPQGVVLPGVRESAQRYGVAVDDLAVDRARQTIVRFPQFQVDATEEAVLEPAAGYLLVEECVKAHLQAAEAAGAELHFEEPALGWRVEHGQAIVTTLQGEYRAPRLILTAGAWTGPLLADLRIPLRVVRKHFYWYADDNRAYRADAGCPVFFYEKPHGYFYGLPAIDGRGIKVAEHSGGGDLATDPTHLDPSPEPADFARVDAFLHAHLPQGVFRNIGHNVCMYTLTPDEHFILDRHPAHDQVSFVAGLSGHGYKFAPVLGETIACWSLDGGDRPVPFFALDRLALQPPV
ncbi:N-methyl-L-tryptophan oxidase [Lignipirellula cremea]|uniref:Monomeric sarcosine oxidase n=1 Tax=Lignipirellula cremea TaxID=2528010 RepID=A0A518DU73_9BACT|nr:N-methyl-L-tryptophan oxidase [Lignipirellula cremea]QDU95378.1 Monomeric sarcosine oxidase [Lignipirellula cremea]